MFEQRVTLEQCLVCGSARFERVREVGPYRVVRCLSCGLQFTNPQPSNAELGEIYGADYFLTSDGHASELKQATAAHYVDLLSKSGLLRGKRLLEIGCGHGDFLATAARLGFDATGVEYSRHACDVAQAKLGERGRIVCGEIDTLANRAGEFDVCVFCDVIEHVRRPDEFVRLVHDLLTPGGLAFVATPSLDSWSARMLGRKWMEYKAEHLTYFSRPTLRRLLTQTGFAIIAEPRGAKVLSIDYVADHFVRYPVRGVTSLVRATRALTPRPWRRSHLRVVASGMIMIAQRREK